MLLRILDPGPPFPGLFAFFGPKILDTKIVHTSGKIFVFWKSKISILWVEKCRFFLFKVCSHIELNTQNPNPIFKITICFTKTQKMPKYVLFVEKKVRIIKKKSKLYFVICISSIIQKGRGSIICGWYIGMAELLNFYYQVKNQSLICIYRYIITHNVYSIFLLRTP